jgi:hypothetical protein
MTTRTRRCRRPDVFAATLALSIVATARAVAQEVNEGWKVSITGYAWAPAYDNDVKDSATGQTSHSSASFTDWIGNLRSVPVIVKGEAQYDRVGVIGDLIYLPLSQSSTINRPILGPIKVKTDVTTTTATAAGFYRAYQTDQLNIDLLGGFRYVKLELGLDVNGPRAGFSSDPSASFTEAIVGARATQRLGTKTSVTGYGDYGGFGGSKTVWQLIGTLNYQWTPKATAFAGWRHFVIEVDKSRLSSDVTMSGPLLGLTYRF